MNENIYDYLDYLFPDAKCELNYNKDYEFLIAVSLSAQTTDKKVNKVTSVLFEKYDSLEKLMNADINDIEDIIREIGTYRKKALFVKKIVKSIYEYGGYVPNDRKFLEGIKGVGHKTSNVVLATLFDEPAMAVDTHVKRVSERLGISNSKDSVLDVERKLMKKVPRERWNRTHHQLVLFGRYKCKAIIPLCSECKIKEFCNYKRKTGK